MQTNNCTAEHKVVGKENRSGDYPFPLTEGPYESPYLTWIRHRSNYMALRGPLDYIRSLGVLVRGILINLLVITPWLLIIACLVSFSYNKMVDYPYLLTKIVVSFWFGSVLLWPVFSAIANIVVYKRTLKYGSGSSVNARDLYERTFGFWLILIIAAIAFDSFPLILATFHELLTKDPLPLDLTTSAQADHFPSDTNTILTQTDSDTTSGGLSPWLGGLSLGSIVALAATSHKMLSAMGGLRRKLFITMLAMLGLLVPCTAVLFVVDYLIFGDAPDQFILTSMNIIVFIGGAVVLTALIIGLIRKTFGWKETTGAIIILGTLLTMNLAGFGLIQHADYSEGSVRIDMRSKSIASANQLLDFWGDPEQGLSIGVDWQGYFTTDEDLENARQMFIKLVREPLTDMVRAEPLSSTLWDKLETIYTKSVRSEHTESDTLNNIEPHDLEPLAEIYTVVIGGYDYHLNKPKTERKPLDLTSPSVMKLLTEDLRDALVTDSKGKAIYPAFKVYESAFISGIDKFKVKNSKLLEDMSIVLNKNRDEQYFPPEPQPRPENNPTDNNYYNLELSRNGDLYNSLSPRKIERDIQKQSREHFYDSRALYIIAIAIMLWVYCWFLVDINSTSIHALYRDRLASTFLIGIDTKGDIGIEHDIDMEDINSYAAGSTAPYHLVNAALNLQGSKDIGTRNRKCGFFIFSKRFTGSLRTGYCRSEVMEQVFPQMSLATAMAISAAAASPNMGRGTSPALVAFMTMLNIRLGIWIPNPGRVEERLYKFDWWRRKSGEKIPMQNSLENGSHQRTSEHGFDFEEVFDEELKEIEQRWEQAYDDIGERDFLERRAGPSADRNLVGLALSGGGIRSATINLGITQALVKGGVFHHIDFMSTVSGGGYLGASISTLMRTYTRRNSAISGKISIEKKADGRQVVTVRGSDPTEERQYVYSKSAILNAKDGDEIRAGHRLIFRPGTPACAIAEGIVTIEKAQSNGEQLLTITSKDGSRTQSKFSRFDEIKVNNGDKVSIGDTLIDQQNTFADRFRWRVRPAALLLEALGMLDSRSRWVNLSDGGHIENLAVFELLRRRCRFIIAGDGEADPLMHFAGLATLIRTARIDLGVEISIDLEDLCLDSSSGLSTEHWSVARIHYPNDEAEGVLLYLKSSLTGDEDASIAEYRHRNPTFPHESTADQFFVEDQFEAYRALGQHIAEDALKHLPEPQCSQENVSTSEPSDHTAVKPDELSFDAFEQWFLTLSDICDKRVKTRNNNPHLYHDQSDKDQGTAPAGIETQVDRADSRKIDERSNVVEELSELD